jgi:eukaryotic-like serine/threonine-protein kinase
MSQAHTTGDTPTIGTPTTASTGLDLDLSGRQLGDYRLLRRLGRGAMADVYLAEQGSLRRQVALKILKRELAADETYVRRFDMEAQAAASLVQANIVQIYEVGFIDPWHYIAQEYVEGQNVAQYLQRHGTLDFKLAMAVLRQVTAALCKAADRGIVHRDIKPENIMLAKSGEVKVADFGLARIGAGEETMKLTQVGITMGTPLYMSPEQVEGRQLDPRSDVYSLGVTCYHMLAGQPPFRGDTALSVALQHVRTQPERLENLRPDIPPALSRVIHKMLSKDPAERYATPRDLLIDLRSLRIEGVDLQWPADLDELGGVESAALGAPSWAATQRLQAVMNRGQEKPSRRWLYLCAAAMVGAIVIGGGLNLLIRGPFLLNVQASTNPREDVALTAPAQFLEASSRTDEESAESAWRALIDEFPDDGFYTPMAKIQLAFLYLQPPYGDAPHLEKAKSLFEQLATGYRSVDKQFRADGLAGQAVVSCLLHEPQSSMKNLEELGEFLSASVETPRSNSAGGGPTASNTGAGGQVPIWDLPPARAILDSRFPDMLDQVFTNNRSALNDKDAAELKKILERSPAVDQTSTQADAAENQK